MPQFSRKPVSFADVTRVSSIIQTGGVGGGGGGRVVLTSLKRLQNRRLEAS